MLWARANADEARGNLSQNGKPFQQANHEREGTLATRRCTSDNSTVNKDLHSLNQARRPFAPRLYLMQIIHGNWTVSQFFREEICGRYRVLDGKIDSDAACRGHGMCRIADAKQSFPAPIAQTIDLDGKQFDFGPVVQLSHSVAKKPGETDDIVLKLRQTACFNLVKAALRNDKASLPIIIAVE